MLDLGLGSRTLTVALLIALALGLVATMPRLAQVRIPGNDQGYAPEQPIKYSHRLHAGELGIDCLYCHTGAETSRHAGVPAASTCMNCHKQVTATLVAQKAEEARVEAVGGEPKRIVSPELKKLYDALGLNDTLARDPAKPQKPITWVRIHKLPDHVFFPHNRHVAAGVLCQTCHGPVEEMNVVRQHATLSMGWCIDCHRGGEVDAQGMPYKASLDCAACHY